MIKNILLALALLSVTAFAAPLDQQFLFSYNDTLTTLHVPLQQNFPYIINGSSGFLISSDIQYAFCTAETTNTTRKLYFNNSQVYACTNQSALAAQPMDIELGNASDLNYRDVWDANFTAVWHLSNNTFFQSNNMARDSTRYGQNASVASDFNFTSSGCASGQCALGTVGSRFFTLTPTAIMDKLNQTMTVEFWITLRSGYAIDVFFWDRDGNDERRFSFQTVSGRIRMGMSIDNQGGGFSTEFLDTDVVENQTYYIVGTWDGSSDEIKLYNNGIFVNLSVVPSTTIGLHNPPAAESIQFGLLRGAIDEIRISNVARSADWINLTYQSMTRNFSNLNTMGQSDLIPPNVSIQSPIGIVTSSPVSLNYTAGDNTALSSCRFRLDGGANTTLASCQNTTFNTTEAMHNITVCAFDPSGNEGCDSELFTLDTIAPSVSITSPSGQTLFNEEQASYNMTLTFTVTDATSGVNLSSCTRSVDNGANVTLVNCASTTFTVTTLGSHNVKVFARDNATNLGSGSSDFSIALTPRLTGFTATTVNLIPFLFALGSIVVALIVAMVGRETKDNELIMRAFVIALVGIVLAAIVFSIVSGLITPVTS